MGFLFSKLMRYVIVAYILFAGIQYGLRWKSYSISPKEFKNIATKAQGDNALLAVNRLQKDLQRAFGSAIEDQPRWTALTLGGLSLKSLFLHASLTEYIAVFGAPFATTGRIGMHWSNSTCTVLTGSVSRLPDSASIINKETFSSGGNFRHGQFESHIYSLAADAYVVCYGRGLIPLSGIVAGVGALSQGEPLSFGHLMYAYAEGSFHQVALAVNSLIQHYKGKATGKPEL